MKSTNRAGLTNVAGPGPTSTIPIPWIHKLYSRHTTFVGEPTPVSSMRSSIAELESLSSIDWEQ